ncbi:L-lactate dehydrogenase [Nesterenkonia salmonea]|uniref:L-lactate dehydrogenase n=1 Tax=Nesterenkonia salmonea TaxID=1804987 RepID=A0A5R9BBA5_9MICC|nr:L-lactate dehydrogenase [Nesterenkonia salmonea]TLP96349.1 L-lactate dehydrogenase [Nesterenkonia salmonea]
MNALENKTVAIIGAGSVGASTAYAVMIRGSARNVRLYDIDAARVEAEVLDLAHGSQFTGAGEVSGSDDLREIEGADVVVITAGAKQHPGQTRLDLAATNVRILRSLMPQLLKRAPNAIYLLVTNPCDVLTTAAQQISGLPAQRVFSTGTVLDTARLRWLLAQQAHVSRQSVHAQIIGEHGDTEFPLWSSASIGATPLVDWEVEGKRIFTPDRLNSIADQVRNAAYHVIKGKGATNYAIGLSAARIIEAILHNEQAVLPVSTVLRGFRGIDGVALSVPSVVSHRGAEPVLTTSLSEAETELLQRSASGLHEVQESLGL